MGTMTSTNRKAKCVMKSLVFLAVVAFTTSATIPLFAAAPVYDANAMPQQMEDSDIGAGPEAGDQNQQDQSNQTQQYASPVDAQHDETQNSNGEDAGARVPTGFQPTETTNNHFDKATHAKDTWPSSSPVPNDANNTNNSDANNDSADNYPSSSPDNSSIPIKQRLRQIELRLDNIQNGETAAKIDALQSQIQTLTSQLEEMSHKLQLMQSQQKAFYDDINHRIMNVQLGQPTAARSVVNGKVIAAVAKTVPATKVSQPGQTAATVAGNKKTLQPVPGSSSIRASKVVDSASTASMEEQQLYQTAYTFIKVRKYSDAISTLQTMLKKYPSGQFTSNAHYWLGELYGVTGNNGQALIEFNTVVNNYPKSPRTADAQLKVGLILASQSNWSDAKAAFKKVIKHYPGTASSQLAVEQLKQLKIAGH